MIITGVIVACTFVLVGVTMLLLVAIFFDGKIMPFCRVGFHDWGKWEAGGITNHYDDWSPTNIPYKRTRRMYRECTKCGIEKMRRVKV